MISNIIARRYAKALFSITEKSGEGEAVKKEIHILSHTIDANRELRNLIFNPIFGRDKKERVIIGILNKIKGRETTKNFVRLLLKKDRIRFLKEIAESLTQLLDEKENRKKAVVITSSKLPEKSLSKIKDKLSAITRKDIEVEERVDGSIIGGIVIQIGSLVYNGSIKTQLDNIKKRLTQTH
ncbi:MAG: ATP synthase F1 subunit delta [Nitrospirota bacterium]